MADLDTRFDRLKLDQGQDGRPQQSGNNLGVPGQGVRKQRSQRFTVPTALNSHSHSAPSPVPPLPYQPPPLPVQAQSANLFHLADQHQHQHQHQQHGLPRSFFPAALDAHSHSLDPYAQFASFPAPPVSATLAPEFLASPTGMSPYPGPAFRPPQSSFTGAYGGVGGAGQGFLGAQQQYQAPGMQQQLSAGSAGGGSRFNNGPVPHVVEDLDEDIIETAIVIKNIPFACPKEQLLNIMSSLALPAPFAFNYHYAPEDPTSFRGLAFANYRDGHEAGVVRAAMDGLEIMGRKLRCEFKKQLKPGEKEAIERTKALKRMRSAQLLAGGGGGGGAPDFGWNRREASAPGGYASGGMVTGASGGGGGGGAGWNAGLGVSAGEDGIEDYGRPLAFGPGTHLGGASSAMGTGLSPSSAPSRGGPPTSFGQREFVPAGGPQPPHHPQQQFQHQRQHSHQHVGHERQHSSHAGATHMEPSYSSESASASVSASPPSSDVGTSVSQRMERGTGSVDSEVGTVATTASVGTAAGGKNDLDLNDPATLELYSRVLLFQGDSLRDELAFSRSLSSQQRRTVHLIAKKLGLEHRSLGDGESRHVVVYKPGTAPPPEARRPLRGSVSTAALRRVASRDGFHPPSSSSRHNSSYLPPPLPTSYLVPSHTGGSSNGSLATSVAGLRGKKSMPNLSAHGHQQHNAHYGGLRGHASSSEEDSRSPSPIPAVPPMPTSISLSAHLAAYASGNGYASAASPLSSSPGGAASGGFGSGATGGGTNAASAAFTRRSYSNLRSMAASPARDTSASSQPQYATVGHSSYAAVGSPSSSRRREIPSVQGLFQAHGIADKDASAAVTAPPSPSRDRSNGYGAAPGTATAARQPSGPGSEVHDWRRRA
ncbi:hypothetical protein JCM3775_006849 [Rhodotorula graminis]|uniref:R3H domain-containing protein n=1 Tax=Rhodotorula graminis (strain WP1) TaxID=578459 RepID=A0A0P9GIC7_RHOGW|nr:uncharacterized protein RHOBADRAFT_55423 [Rhodotorula graminis WP1]KPV72727.1 hypothetical protein RHOBADRAFT_55423 [Rhodotorula graminis WP1]